MSAAPPLLEARGVVKALHGGDEPVMAVAGVELRIARGEFVAIRGPSGSGKSTLLYLLGALDRPTAGEVCIDGASTSGLADPELAALRGRQVGFVFQFHFLLPELDALENVALPMRLRGVAAAEARARAAALLARLDLSNRLSHRPHELSGGQQQRVAIARALANDPAVLLGDELTGNLDTVNSQRVYAWLRELNEQHGQTIVVVTHSAELAAEASRVIELVDGRIVSDRRTRATAEAPASGGTP
ncbi:MAG: ABC transporter ATP-binding protein [Candidatus Sericytochromatia bacterium]|nr:ABC transporter ATP-binding protein [Candidatus Sericytochromatia bacterium]